MSFQRAALCIAVGIVVGWGMSFTPINDETVPYTIFGVSILFLGLISYVWSQYGVRQLLGIVLVGLLGVAIEYLGITTCFPYGCFEYSSYVGPRFFGTFPWLLVMIRPLLVVTITQWGVGSKSLLLNALSGGVLLMAVDLFLDPVAISQGLWSYENLVWMNLQPRFGIPRSNFLGWILTGTISAYLFYKYSNALVGDRMLRYGGLVIIAMYVSAFFFLF